MLSDDFNEIDIYIHLPFCKTKCKFCFYVSFANSGEKTIDLYLNSLKQEIEYIWSEGKKRDMIVKSIYIGGGTPSFLALSQLEHLMDILSIYWDIKNVTEITFECDLPSIDKAKLKFLKAVGVNRISLGIQNIDDNILKEFDREGASGQFPIIADKLNQIGFSNINCDLILGIPYATFKSSKNSLDALVKKNIPHITLYPFILRKNAEIFKNDQIHKEFIRTKSERLAEFQESVNFLIKHGYIRLGTSCFAVDSKYKCIQNEKYWSGGNILGFGVSAQSFINGLYIKNTDDLREYINNVPNVQSLNIKLEKDDLIRRIIVLGLSNKMKIRFSDIKSNYGPHSIDFVEGELSAMSIAGLIKLSKEEIRLTQKGFEHISLIPSIYMHFSNEEYKKRIMRLPLKNLEKSLDDQNKKENVEAI